MRSPSDHPLLAHRQVGVAAVLGATAFWSFGGVLAKSTHAQGVVVTFWRMWMGTVVLVALCWATDALPTWTQLRRSVLAGLLFGGNICVFFTALEHVTVASALVVAALAPVLMLPIAVRMLGERLTPVKVLCAVTAVVGVVVSVLSAPAGDDAGHHRALGLTLAAIALLMWIGYLVESKRVRRTIDTLPYMCSITVVSAVAISVLAAVRRSPLGEVHGVSWVWLALLTVGPGVAGHGLVAWAQQRVDASVSTVLMQGEPVGASIAAWFLLHEHLTFVQAGSMAVVIAALCLLVYSEARETAPPFTSRGFARGRSRTGP